MVFGRTFSALTLVAAVSTAAFAQGDTKLGDNSKIFGKGRPKDEKVTSRHVSGTVKDEADKGVGGAIVTLTDTKTKKGRTVTTGPNGSYVFEDLSTAIDYQLYAQKDKSKSATKTLSTFDPRKSPVMNLTLEPPAPATAAK